MHVQPPQIAAPAIQEPLPALPVNAQRKYILPLAPSAPDGPERLLARSQAAFNAGEQDFKAGHLGKAREEFDQALDELLAIVMSVWEISIATWWTR